MSEPNIELESIDILCTCDGQNNTASPVTLVCEGGQYQYTWIGTCKRCGVKWNLNCEAYAENKYQEESE